MCKPNDHRFRKLNERQLFCARCSEVRTVSGTWVYRQWQPSWPPYTPYWTTTNTTTGNTTFTIWHDVMKELSGDFDAEEREESNDRKD